MFRIRICSPRPYHLATAPCKNICRCAYSIRSSRISPYFHLNIYFKSTHLPNHRVLSFSKTLEKWQSGWMWLTRNQLYLKGYRGFESLLLRHWAQPKTSLSLADTKDENRFDERSNRDWRWGTEGYRFVMRQSLTNPSFSAIPRLFACLRPVPVGSWWWH